MTSKDPVNKYFFQFLDIVTIFNKQLMAFYLLINLNLSIVVSHNKHHGLYFSISQFFVSIFYR